MVGISGLESVPMDQFRVLLGGIKQYYIKNIGLTIFKLSHTSVYFIQKLEPCKKQLWL